MDFSIVLIRLFDDLSASLHDHRRFAPAMEPLHYGNRSAFLLTWAIHISLYRYVSPPDFPITLEAALPSAPSDRSP
jgi:hypothetical protein